MNIRPFFKKHSRLRTLICPHYTTTDIGIFTDWNGKETIVCQCDVCGKIRIGEKINWFPLPGEIFSSMSKNA